MGVYNENKEKGEKLAEFKIEIFENGALSTIEGDSENIVKAIAMIIQEQPEVGFLFNKAQTALYKARADFKSFDPLQKLNIKRRRNENIN
jgi:hypothetical protein